MTLVFQICFILLSLSLVLTVYRLIKGPVVVDRVLAVDLMGVIIAGIILVGALAFDQIVFLDVVVVLGIMVFFGTVALARTLSRNS